MWHSGFIMSCPVCIDITVQFGLFSVFYHRAETCPAFVSGFYYYFPLLPVKYDRLPSLRTLSETIPWTTEVEWLFF